MFLHFTPWLIPHTFKCSVNNTCFWMITRQIVFNRPKLHIEFWWAVSETMQRKQKWTANELLRMPAWHSVHVKLQAKWWHKEKKNIFMPQIFESYSKINPLRCFPVSKAFTEVCNCLLFTQIPVVRKVLNATKKLRNRKILQEIMRNCIATKLSWDK